MTSPTPNDPALQPITRAARLDHNSRGQWCKSLEADKVANAIHMTGNKLRGLFVDLDGTLADSLQPLRNAYEAFLTGYGRRGSVAEFESLNGPPVVEIVHRLKLSHDLPGSRDDLVQRYTALFDEAYLSVRACEGSRDLLTHARDAGYAIAVVTSTRRCAAEAWLEKAGLQPLVDVVVGGDDVAKGKPDPDPYLHALALSGCNATLSFAVEDSLQGSQAAMKAGIPTFLLGTHKGLPQASPHFAGTIARLQDLIPKLRFD